MITYVKTHRTLPEPLKFQVFFWGAQPFFPIPPPYQPPLSPLPRSGHNSSPILQRIWLTDSSCSQGLASIQGPLKGPVSRAPCMSSGENLEKYKKILQNVLFCHGFSGFEQIFVAILLDFTRFFVRQNHYSARFFHSTYSPLLIQNPLNGPYLGAPMQDRPLIQGPISGYIRLSRVLNNAELYRQAPFINRRWGYLEYNVECLVTERKCLETRHPTKH